ncbi:MAG: serine acetyltransferase [Gammaproteobacteria bacterium]
MKHWAALRADVGRTWALARGGPVARTLECLRTPGVHAVVVLRFGQWARSMPVVLRLVLDPLYVVLNGLIQILWGIEIPRGTVVGPGLYIGHFGGITISSQAVIGRHCNLSQNITIGLSGSGESRGVPVLGDNVYIAPGARLFGKITIGNNVKIGANAVIYKSVPDNSIAVLDPGFRILRTEAGSSGNEG